ncbi:MAG: right-handed parallel beta-helix repeat-containing protein [Candidatus Krumholzibacteriia bacterium]
MRWTFAYLLAVGLLPLGFASRASAMTYTVRLDGSGNFSAIQPAIDACSAGDTVLVGPGTYAGAANRDLDFHGVDLVLLSELGRDQTEIDCEEAGRGFYLHSGETLAAAIAGFSVRNAFVDIANGGGLYCTNASISLLHSRFASCYAGHGGGVTIGTGSGHIDDCEFVNCHGLATGGALVVAASATADIHNTVFESNSAGEGGALRVTTSALTITDCTFDSNLDAGDGGAISLDLNSTATIAGTTFVGNHGYNGGAIALYRTPDVTISNCWFEGNSAGNKGGAIWYESSSTPPPTAPTIEGCLFLGNGAEGGGAIGLWLNASLHIARCSFVGNSESGEGGGAIRCDNASSPTIEQVLIVENPGGGIFTRLGSEPVLSCCDVWDNPGGNFTGEMVDPTGSDGNISMDPMLCLDLNPSNPYTLRADSPCAPTGNDCGVQIGAFGVGCDVVATEDTSWSAVKSRY